MADAVERLRHRASLVHSGGSAFVAALIGNMTPLYGVLYWQWDTFQLLMLYWAETVTRWKPSFWTLMR